MRLRAGNFFAELLCLSSAMLEARLQLYQSEVLVTLFGGLAPERVWVISIARLRTSLPLHLRPIDVLVLNDPYMEILS